MIDTNEHPVNPAQSSFRVQSRFFFCIDRSYINGCYVDTPPAWMQKNHVICPLHSSSPRGVGEARHSSCILRTADPFRCSKDTRTTMEEEVEQPL